MRARNRTRISIINTLNLYNLLEMTFLERNYNLDTVLPLRQVRKGRGW